MATPRVKARIKLRIDAPPSNSKVVKTIITVIEVLIERASVWFRLALVISSKLFPGVRRRFSRIRSNTTIVSLTEKPRIVSKAVINKASTSILGKKCPMIEKAPTTNKISWASAIIVVTANRHEEAGFGTDRKEKAINKMMAIQATITAVTAF